MRRIQDIKDLRDKKVLVRVDYNVPLKDGLVSNNERIVASLETIEYLLEAGAAVVLMSHLGRPDGEIKPEFSLSQVKKELDKLSNKSVQFVGDCIGEDRDNAVSKAKNGDIILLENTRFYADEEAGDSLFAQKLARFCDYYVNDAFSASHRAHASVSGVAEYLPAYAGFSLQKEVDHLGKLLNNPKKPFVLVSGGAKISDKIKILNNLVNKVDVILIGGGMANTFLCSQRKEVGCSLFEEEYVKTAGELLLNARVEGTKILLPTDVVVTKAISENARGRKVSIDEVDELDIIADLGPDTIDKFITEIKTAGTIFWNGPLGVSEVPAFAKSTLEVGNAIAKSGAFSVIGGGDTIAALPEDLQKKFSFVSMAGGASMEFLEGKELPGIKILGD
jgi:phosphoglycerate kinase